MASKPEEWIDELASSSEQLASLVAPLSAEQLRGPSYCSEWTIAQVLSHLGSQAEIFPLMLDAALGNGEAPDRSLFPPIWDAWNAKTPDEQVRDGLASDAALVSRVRSLSPEELEKLHLSFFGMELDAVGILRMRLSEHAVHTWDVAVALDPSAELAPGAVALLIDGLGDMAARIGKPQEKAFTLQVRTAGPARELVLSVGDEVSLRAGSAESPDGTLELPAEALIRLVYGRLDGQPSTVKLSAGDLELADLQAVFPGF